MGNAIDFNPEEQEQFFGEIMRLYDLTDELVNAVGRDGVKDRAQQLNLVVPIINQVSQSAEVISAAYTKHFKLGQPLSQEEKKELESAYRRIYAAITQFVEAAEEMYTTH